MRAALRVLSAEGAVSVRRSRGTTVGPEPVVPAEPLPEPGKRRDARWRRLAEQLRHEILSGRLAREQRVPSVKQLCARHAVCPATLRRALHALRDEGIIHEDRRGYRMHASAHRGANAVGLVVGSGITDMRPSRESTTWEMDFIRTLEAECLRCGLELVTIVSDEITARPEMLRHVKPNLLGLIASCTPESIRELIRALGVAGAGTRDCPVSLFESHTGGRELLSEVSAATIRIFTPAQRRAGVLVGRYLVRLGHTDVCYVCPYHEQAWSRERLAGLRHAFRQVGARSQAVTEVTCDGVAVLHSSRGETDCTNGIGLMARCTELGNHCGLKPDARAALHDTAATIEESILLDEATEHLVDRALQTGATALVAGTDRAALAVLSLLCARGLNVPGDVSVIGFDDSLAAFRHNLSTYSFAIASCAIRALSFITYRGRDVRPGDTMEMVPGMVVPRSTTASPPTRG